jgi:transcriptional regulator with XRE-family HTH domain
MLQISRKISRIEEYFKGCKLHDMHIGKNIRAIIKELGISQGELSRLTAIPERTISGWINGEDPNPGMQYIQRIANALQVTPGFIADYGNPEARYQRPQTVRAKEEVAKALLADVARKYPYGSAAKALAILESHEEDPLEVQELLAKARYVLVSENEAAVSALRSNIRAFVRLVDAEDKVPPHDKEVKRPRKVGT